jgi:hypothetical protein
MIAERVRPASAAAITGLTVRTVQALALRGEIPGAAKLGGSWTFDVKALKRFKIELDRRKAEAALPKPEPIAEDTVYVVRCGYRVKIGFTTKLAHRLYTLQTGNHRDLELLVSFPASRAIERDLHQKFADLHVRGEWFKLQKPIKEWLWSEHRVTVR